MPDRQHKRLVLGKIGKCHGIKGWVKLHSLTSPSENILDYPTLQLGSDSTQRQLQVTGSSTRNGSLLVHFAGIDDPEAAQALTGAEVWVTAEELPTLEAGEYYWHELEGLQVWNTQGVQLGRVGKLMETGANDVLVVQPTDDSVDARERLIPFLRDRVVKQVDLAAARILVDWDASYLD